MKEALSFVAESKISSHLMQLSLTVTSSPLFLYHREEKTKIGRRKNKKNSRNQRWKCSHTISCHIWKDFLRLRLFAKGKRGANSPFFVYFSRFWNEFKECLLLCLCFYCFWPIPALKVEAEYCEAKICQIQVSVQAWTFERKSCEKYRVKKFFYLVRAECFHKKF